MFYRRELDVFRNMTSFLAVLALTTTSVATAEDKILWRLLAPANLVLMEGNVCASQDPLFIYKIYGKRGNFRDYAQEVKNEVSEGLAMDDLLSVLRRGADAAKIVALADLKPFQSDDPETERRQIRSWCDTTVKNMIQKFIQTHDDDHESFESLLDQGKSLMRSK